MKTINDYKKDWDKLSVKCNLSGEEALEAVKKNGDALRYVKEQTEAICLEAVKKNGYALRYVKEQIFKEELEMVLIGGLKFSKATIAEALREYINKAK